MSAIGDKQGPLTVDEIRQVWASAVDKSYRDPLLDAGDGRGLESYNQAFTQYARISQAIDRTTQSMYLRQHSSQSDLPSAGGAIATVELTLSRTGFLELPLILGAGTTVVQEQTNDSGENGPEPVLTGRRYLLAEDLIFLPGVMGPLTVAAMAEKPGYGYNNPLPGTITVVAQPGTEFYHDKATVLNFVSPLTQRTEIVAVNEADMFVPDHVGQYVQFVNGANDGKIGRAVAYLPPDLTDPDNLIGSSLQLQQVACVEAFSLPSAPFIIGEDVVISTIAGVQTKGRLLAYSDNGTHAKLAIELTDGPEVQTIYVGNPASVVAVRTALASVPVSHVLSTGLFDSETQTAAWRILDWVIDWGLVATNVAAPSGGRLAMLDLLGGDRGQPRHIGETDDIYRARIVAMADVVSPNAIKRAVQGSFGGYKWTLREPGQDTLRGCFFDTHAPEDCLDSDTLIWSGTTTLGAFTEFQEPVEYRNAGGDVIASGYFGGIVAGNFYMIRKVNGEHVPVAGDVIVGLLTHAEYSPVASIHNPYRDKFRWDCLLSLLEFRAFFIIEMQRLDLDDFGSAYEESFADTTFFYDGYAVGNSIVYRRVYQAVDAVRAAGVGFDLVLTEAS